MKRKNIQVDKWGSQMGRAEKIFLNKYYIINKAVIDLARKNSFDQ